MLLHLGYVLESSLRVGLLIKVLHVINDISSDMRYGGPAMNCMRHSKYLESPECSVTVWGTYSTEPLAYKGNSAIFLKNRIFLPKFRFTFQFSLKNIWSLYNAIRAVDIVHVHFAREINPVVSSIMTLLLRKKLILQTHGMVVKRTGMFYRLWDILFTNMIFSKASYVLPLQEAEKRDLQKFPISDFLIVPNGIDFEECFENQEVRSGVVFISRIHDRKRSEIFVEAAIQMKIAGFLGKFAIYGEDAGYLPKLKLLLEKDDLLHWYKGGVEHDEALAILGSSELLVLPSDFEPFPMVVLESLSLGTPVIIMNDCGIADKVAGLDPLFVCSNSASDISRRAFEILAKYQSVSSRLLLAKNARSIFSIMRTVEGFERAYLLSIRGDKVA